MSELKRAARTTLDRYLKRVAVAMRHAGHGADEIEAVREGLREQILELAGRGSPRVGRDAIEAAIASLDAPESYAPADATPSVGAQRSGLARLSAASCVIGAVIVVGVGFLGTPVYKDAGGGAFVIAELVALAAGVIARRDPWGRFGALASALLLVLLVAMLLFSS